MMLWAGVPGAITVMRLFIERNISMRAATIRANPLATASITICTKRIPSTSANAADAARFLVRVAGAADALDIKK
jgi:hypothetical protein